MKTKFILVDDDPVSNKICNFTIKKVLADASVECFEYPADGLNYIESTYSDPEFNAPTVLFLDINMPQINGWEFLNEFAKMDEHLQIQFTIYIVSTSIDTSDLDKAAAHPLVAGYFEKPMNMSIIENLVNT